MGEAPEKQSNEADRSALGIPHSARNTHHAALPLIFRLARKELREILRDRRTIVTLIAMPLLLYPVMSVVFLQFSLASKATTAATPEYRVGALTSPEANAFQRRFEKGQEAWRRAKGE